MFIEKNTDLRANMDCALRVCEHVSKSFFCITLLIPHNNSRRVELDSSPNFR